MTSARLLVHQLRYEQKVFWRNRSGVFFTFAFPLILLVLLNANTGQGYRRFLVPGIASLALVGTSFQGFAIGLSMHRDQGVLKRLKATPMSGGLILAAKITSIAVVVLLELVVVTLAARFAYGIGWPQSPFILAGVCLAGGVSFCSLGIALTTIIPNGDSSPAVTNAIYLPMMFLSGIFYPMSQLPSWLRHIGEALPLYHLATPLRAAFVSGTPPHLWRHLGALGLWGLFGAMRSMRSFRWTPSR